MKLNFRAFLKKFLGIIALNPIETIISLGFFVFSSLIWEKVMNGEDYGNNVFLAPLLFATSYVLNRMFTKGLSRMIYILSAFTLIIIFWVNASDWVFSGAYLASLAIAAVAIAVYNNKKDNNRLVKNILAYAKELFFTMIIVTAVLAVLMATVFSVIYLFDIFKDSSNDIAYYITNFCLIIVAPVSFLFFNADPENKREEFHITKIFEVVINYILTPALMIYTTILYLYIAKIVITWTLPKGNLAYMVFAFIISAIVVKAFIPLVSKPIFARFFNTFSIIALAPLVLFWIGAIHRVLQYGFTEERVYLLVCGVILTLTVFLFISRKHDKYIYIGYITIALLALFSYIPPISAKVIGIRSQTIQLKSVAKDLQMLGENGKLTAPSQLYIDSLSKAKFERMNDIYTYLTKHIDKEKLNSLYGYSGSSGIRTDFGDKFTFKEYNKHNLESISGQFPTAGYGWVNTDVTSLIQNDSLKITTNSDIVIFSIPITMLESKFSARTQRDSIADSLLFYDYENYRVVFLRISFGKDCGISKVSVKALLIK